MPANKTQPTILSVSEFLGSIPDPNRRADASALVKIFGKASGEKPVMWGTAIVGFGTHHYKHESGREGDTPMVSFSPRKAASVLYGISGFEGACVLLATLGKHTASGGCIHVKKLSDIDTAVLEALVTGAVRSKMARPS